MSNGRRDRVGLRRAAHRAAPAGSDPRERHLADALHDHVRLRDACLAPAALIPGKLDAVDHPRPTGATIDGSGVADVAAMVERLSVVSRMSRIRRDIRDTGSLLHEERRLLVLLDVLAALPDAPGDPWSRDPVTLLGEAATGLGFRPSDVRRLARHLDVARRALPLVEVAPTTARAVADAVRDVLHTTPGAAVAHATLLLTGEAPTGWAPPMYGTALLERAPGDASGFLGVAVARHDLGAFVADLSTLRVASDLSPAVHAATVATLPHVALALRSTPAACAEEGDVLDTAAALADHTVDLVGRGFRRFDRAARPRWIVLDA